MANFEDFSHFFKALVIKNMLGHFVEFGHFFGFSHYNNEIFNLIFCLLHF